MARSWKTAICAALAVVLLLALSGCGSHEPASGGELDLHKDLEGKTWTLESMGNRKVSDDPALTLTFKSDGTVAGFGGCNQFHGTYTLSGDSLTFGPLASTKKSCGPILDEQEICFTSLLANVERVHVEDDELVLSTDTSQKITFTSGSGGLFW